VTRTYLSTRPWASLIAGWSCVARFALALGCLCLAIQCAEPAAAADLPYSACGARDRARPPEEALLAHTLHACLRRDAIAFPETWLVTTEWTGFLADPTTVTFGAETLRLEVFRALLATNKKALTTR